jgi:hypothetical protein
MEVIISNTVFKKFLAIFEPDSSQEIKPEEQLLRPLLYCKKRRIPSLICNLRSTN